MERAGIAGPQACPKGLRHAFGIAAVEAGVPLPTIAAVLGHADISTTAIYTTAVGIEARTFLARMWTPGQAMRQALEDDMEGRPGVYRRLAAS